MKKQVETRCKDDLVKSTIFVDNVLSVEKKPLVRSMSDPRADFFENYTGLKKLSKFNISSHIQILNAAD